MLAVVVAGVYTEATFLHFLHSVGTIILQSMFYSHTLHSFKHMGILGKRVVGTHRTHSHSDSILSCYGLKGPLKMPVFPLPKRCLTLEHYLPSRQATMACVVAMHALGWLVSHDTATYLKNEHATAS